MLRATPNVIPEVIEVNTADDVLLARVEECLNHPLSQSFRESLDRLASIAGNVQGRVKLYRDFSPLSFGFSIIRPGGSAWISGGLIFHGPHDRGGDGGGPTFSVNLVPVEGWQIHT